MLIYVYGLWLDCKKYSYLTSHLSANYQGLTTYSVSNSELKEHKLYFSMFDIRILQCFRSACAMIHTYNQVYYEIPKVQHPAVSLEL